MPHVPVLLQEVIDKLHIRKGATVVDGTADGGGHARELLHALDATGKLVCIEWDETQARALRQEFNGHANVSVVHGNYADMRTILDAHDIARADAVLLDLGFSSMQLEASGRGFSFALDEPLLMTYDADTKPARDMLRTMSEREIADVIWKFGEERYARRIARRIVEARKEHPILTSKELSEIIVRAVPRQKGRMRIHPATRTFQALRIFVNRELENLEQFLKCVPDILAPEGRIAIISFHSLEDRIVKQSFREYARAGVVELLNKKPIVATPDEIQRNPRSRSAKLRAALMNASISIT